MISLRNVSLAVKEKTLLDGISFDFEDGRVYGLLGPNGAGKTTLMKSVLGLTRYSGEILSDGKSVDCGELGSLIEYPSFYPRLTARENLELHARYRKEGCSDVMGALDRVGLGGVADVPVTKFSLGMRQRLGIARACIGSPRYLLLDEPTNGLDPLGIKEVRGLLRGELRRSDGCILVSSHNLAELTLVSDELVFVRDGRVVLSTPCIEGVSGAEALYEKVFGEKEQEGGDDVTCG